MGSEMCIRDRFLEETVPWSWVSMVAALRDEDLYFVVTGGGHSRGLVSCEFSPRPNSYDAASSRALRDQGLDVNVKLPVWDFLVTRDDGSTIRLHPEFTTTKMKTLPGEGHAEEPEIPRKGYGMSSGEGSFLAEINRDVKRIVRFDPKKTKKEALPESW